MFRSKSRSSPLWQWKRANGSPFARVAGRSAPAVWPRSSYNNAFAKTGVHRGPPGASVFPLRLNKQPGTQRRDEYGVSSIGRVAVSKTVGWGFESLTPCQFRPDQATLSRSGGVAEWSNAAVLKTALA